MTKKLTDNEFARKQIDNLLATHAASLYTWKGFEIIGRPCWMGMRGHRVICNGLKAQSQSFALAS